MPSNPATDRISERASMRQPRLLQWGHIKHTVLYHFTLIIIVITAHPLHSSAIGEYSALLTQTPIAEMTDSQLTAISQLIEHSRGAEREELLGLLSMNLAYSKAVEERPPLLAGQNSLKVIVLTVMNDKSASREGRRSAASTLALGWSLESNEDIQAVRNLYDEFAKDETPEGHRMREAIRTILNWATKHP